ncbi:Vacuolar protein sorting-associated protein 16 homolog [Gryllus bimaculatus]|nr:Vacuolar protein sorting-associated protein 16 homolog [Gryllus bimaculatus]
MSAMLTADWCPLGRDTYFRKFDLYSMGWQHELRLENVAVASAPYGGPLAVVRDRKKFVQVQGSGKPVISLYSAAGQHLASIVWSGTTLVALGWSASEELLCIQDDGSVLRYDIFGTYQHTFSMGKDAKDGHIVDARVFATAGGTGVAVLSASGRFFLVLSVADPKLRTLPAIPEMTGANAGSLTTWAVVPEERGARVLVSRNRDLYSLSSQETRAEPVAVPDLGLSSVIEIAVSLDGRHTALLTDNGHLWMGSADLRRKYADFDTKMPGKPRQLVWCGSEAVLGLWGTVLLLVGRRSPVDSISYSYDSPVHLVPELDGVRVVGAQTHELLQRVPPVVQSILRINSTSPGAYLLEASRQFQKQSHRADEYVHLVRGHLAEAVQNCLEAAGHEFNTDTQKSLLRAAQFGKCFLADYDPTAYVDMCRMLRVLNAVRSPRVGIPLTITQLRHLSVRVLLDRLVLRRHYYLAIQAAKHLRLPEVEGSSRVLAHWACYKVNQTQLDREQVARDIANKLGYAPGVSYSEIADKANNAGRRQLAVKLIDYEPRASLQVPLLLRLEEYRPALVKAIESGDTDLVYTVLEQLRENMPLGEFQLCIRNYPVAQALYLKYCRDHNPETLRDIYVQEDDFLAQASFFVRESLDPKNSAREASLAAAQDSFRRARADLNATLCEEQQRLLRYQKGLEDKFGREFSGLSLHDTVRALLLMREVKLADKLRAEYRVPDRRYWWLRILCMAHLGDWEELVRFSKTKKSPIGYEPFVDVCVKHKSPYAEQFLPRVQDELKVKYYAKAGLLEKACQVAVEQRDVQALLFVRSCCAPTDRELLERITAQIAQLSNKK